MAPFETMDTPPIGPHDPPPVTIINRHGASRVLLAGDHVSNAIPLAMGNLGLAPEVLRQHVAYDIGTDKLIRHLAQYLDAPAVLAGYSRLIVDLNRSLEDPTAFPEVSDNIPIPGNQGLSREDKALRISSIYKPYRVAIDEMLNAFRSRGITPALIAIHSFTPAMAGVWRPWHVGLLWDKDPRIPKPLLKRLRAHPEGFNIGDNQPYSGKHPADYTIDHHAETNGLPHVSIEVRQDLIDDDAGAERWAEILHQALAGILADDQLYRVLGT